MTLGETILKDIDTMLDGTKAEKVYKQVGRIYKESINNANRKAIDPDGSERIELSDEAPWYYRTKKAEATGRDKPDLRFSGNAERSLTYDIKDDGFNMYHSDPDAAYYMYKHEYGIGHMPKRRQFPTDEGEFNDSDSSYQKPNIEKVTQIVTKHLNSKRKLNFYG